MPSHKRPGRHDRENHDERNPSHKTACLVSRFAGARVRPHRVLSLHHCGKKGSEVVQSLSGAGVDTHPEHGVAFLPGRTLNRDR